MSPTDPRASPGRSRGDLEDGLEDAEAYAEAEDALARAPVTLVVPEDAAGERLDRYLTAALAGPSRALLQKHIAAGAVTIGGAAPRRGASTALEAGERVEYRPPPPPVVDLVPEAIPLSILFEDEHLLIVDKPNGLVVHPAAGHPRGTLANAVLFHLHGELASPSTGQELASPLTGQSTARPEGPRSALQARGGPAGELVSPLTGQSGLRPGIVHRLDRGTTGAIVVAKTEAMQDALGRLFQARLVEKRYLAVTVGVPEPAAGTIDTAYGRHPTDRKRFSSRVAGGKRAVTHYRVAEAFGSAALVEVRLETGRTHQIRVHLADRGYPLIGDPVYGRRRGPVDFVRPALHAHRLAFDHPVTGERIEAVAPVPADLAGLLAALRGPHV